MMNVLAISLVLITLVTAGVFSPNTENKGDDVIVKEGHRVVVVEYEPNDGHTKVSISPQETEKTGYVSDVKDKSSEKVEDVKDKIKHVTSSSGELVCDAFGKCKHRIASALEGTKEKLSEKMHEIEEDAKEGFEKASEKASEVKEKAKESVGKKVDEVKEGVKETAEKVRIKAVDTTDTLKRHVKKNASEDLEVIEAKAKDAKDAVEGKRDYQVIRKFFSHVSTYIFSAKHFRSLMGLIHLLGFALSYGVCVWVTFVSSNILARALPKQQFAMVQSKIYPVYFKTMSYGIAAAFLGHYLCQRQPYYANRTETIQGIIFVATFSMTMFNSFYLEPRATKVMRERIKLEKEEGKGKDAFSVEPSTSSVDAFEDPTGAGIGAQTTTEETLETKQELSEEAQRVKPQVERLSQRLKKLNVTSSVLNGLSLMGLTYHLVYLSQLLHSTSY
ncbi:putative GDSL esterase/lipase 5-like [Capsicum annuum]|nr:putative GDSL esterase/lipase 5-like [Capsicum annuum]